MPSHKKVPNQVFLCKPPKKLTQDELEAVYELSASKAWDVLEERHKEIVKHLQIEALGLDDQYIEVINQDGTRVEIKKPVRILLAELQGRLKMIKEWRAWVENCGKLYIDKFDKSK